MKIDDYLETIRKTPAEVDAFLTARDATGLQPNRGWTYDAELGWVHADAVHNGDGVGGTDTFYHYEADGGRRILNNRDKPSRIHTYGDSYTHCDQVNDGETWQEHLAAHLNEPVRNFGTGGYSVYQAYRRMKKVHRERQNGALQNDASHIVLNIYEDDHYRNLDSWRALRHGRRSNCGFTLPHLRVDVDRETVEERENLLSTREEVYKMCDLDYLRQTFSADPILQMAVRLRTISETKTNDLEPVPISVGMIGSDADNEEAREIRREYIRAALYATEYVVQQVEQFCHDNGKQLFVILSFASTNMLRSLRGEAVFDRPFAEWIKGRGYPVFDMRDAFAAEHSKSKLEADHFLQPYYNGHHSPAGNFFTAWALKDSIVEWLGHH
jgi:hypothetical protein